MSGFEVFAAALAAGSSVVQTARTISSGKAAARQASAQAAFLQTQADYQRQLAAAQEAALRRRQSREQGRMRALLADRGVDISAGSPLLVQQQAAGDAEFAALLQRSGDGAKLFGAEFEASMARARASQARSNLAFDTATSLLGTTEKLGAWGKAGGLFWPKKPKPEEPQFAYT